MSSLQFSRKFPWCKWDTLRTWKKTLLEGSTRWNGAQTSLSINFNSTKSLSQSSRQRISYIKRNSTKFTFHTKISKRMKKTRTLSSTVNSLPKKRMNFWKVLRSRKTLAIPLERIWTKFTRTHLNFKVTSFCTANNSSPTSTKS